LIAWYLEGFMSLNWLRKRWGPALVALSGLAVMAAVACGGDEDPTATTAAGQTPTATTAPATATQPPSGGSPTATATRSAATATATRPPSGGGGPSGSLVRAFSTLEAVYGIGYVGPYRTSATNQIGGIEDELFYYKDGNAMTPLLVDTWSIDPAGTKATMTLKQDIPFYSPKGFENMDFGVLDAAEVVEWFNRSNATTNPDTTYGDAGDFAAIFLEASVVDEYTLEVGLVSPVFFCLPISQFGCLSAARGPTKVTHADTEGLEWARAHHIGTGPYVQGNCVAGDRCTMHAVNNHWRHTANVAEITGIQVPEANTQIAMMRNGAVDLATIDYQLLPDIVDGTNFRFLETMPGGFVGQSVIFSGNLWEENHARTGQPLNPWNSPVYAQDYPWIGDPWQQIRPANVKYQDDDNPAGMTDMEQARLVRLALSVAIDRDGINETLLNDIGLPIYSEYMGPEYPGWDPNRSTGVFDVNGNKIAASGTAQSVPWQLDDANLQEAGRLLDLAGYPLVGGSRQGFASITLQAYAAEAGPVGLEVADAIMSDWSRLGIQTVGLIEDYGGVISPRMAKREQFNPVLKNGDVHSNVYPLDWPMPTVDTSSSRPGWGPAFESPAGAKWLFEILAERDPSVREQKHLTWVDYSMFWVQYAGVFQVPKGIVANSRIKSWNGNQEHYSNISGDPDMIVLN
jgi:ABC-type transport system substrate-binding protein